MTLCAIRYQSWAMQLPWLVRVDLEFFLRSWCFSRLSPDTRLDMHAVVVCPRGRGATTHTRRLVCPQLGRLAVAEAEGPVVPVL